MRLLHIHTLYQLSCAHTHILELMYMPNKELSVAGGSKVWASKVNPLNLHPFCETWIVGIYFDPQAPIDVTTGWDVWNAVVDKNPILSSIYQCLSIIYYCVSVCVSTLCMSILLHVYYCFNYKLSIMNVLFYFESVTLIVHFISATFCSFFTSTLNCPFQ